MKIASSQMQLQAQHQSVDAYIQREHFQFETTPPRQGPPPGRPSEGNRGIGDTMRLSHAAARAQPVRKKGEVDPGQGPSSIEQTKLQALIRFVEQVTGKKFKLFDPRELQQTPEGGNEAAGGAEAPAAPGRPRAGFSMEYDYYEARIEQEQTSFSAQGQVQTADGKTINVELQLNMSRSFIEENSISIRAGDPKVKDPLVLNFDGTAAEFGEGKFTFDLDADGRNEQVSVLNGNSGFLALDKNGDGKINDGSELFGAQSGNGFADLAAYDEDGNQWIDENDSIYSKLRVWTRDASGNDTLVALGQRDVGAIYLGNVATSFDLKNSDNQLQGQVVSSSLFLKDSGGAGTVQQLNLVV